MKNITKELSIHRAKLNSGCFFEFICLSDDLESDLRNKLAVQMMAVYGRYISAIKNELKKQLLYNYSNEDIT